MTLAELLRSLTSRERDYIASRDYGTDTRKHRDALDSVIRRGGAVNMAAEYWAPYEVIELCKNQVEDGHEREFAACAAIVLKNILDGSDRSTDIASLTEVVAPHIERLPDELQALLNALFDAATKRPN